MATPENHPTFLDNANLRGANLVGAILERANLTGANLQNADLSRATLLGTNLYNANLAFAKLGSVNLAHLDCTGIDDIRAVLIAAGAKDMSPPDAGDASEPDAP